MNNELLLIFQDAGGYLLAVIVLVITAVGVILSVCLTTTPEHRNRYQLAEDDAGDTHTSWELHRAQIPKHPLRAEPAAAGPRPRVRAISSVRTAHDAKLGPRFDSRVRPSAPVEHHRV
jgi:hypothetical protein